MARILANVARASLPESLRKAADALPDKVRKATEADPVDVRIAENRRRWGRALVFALAKSGKSRDEAAREMGYGDNQTSIGRWCDGEENIQLGKLALLGDEFMRWFLIGAAGEFKVAAKVQHIVVFETGVEVRHA